VSKRIAVIAPRGRDAPVITATLQAASLDVAITTLDRLLASLAGNDFGAALLTQEALTGVSPAAVREAVAMQPSWSDFPFVLLTSPLLEQGPMRIADALGNVMQVERPVRPATLVNCARSALRARLRQHEMRSMLAQQAAAEREISELAQSLERRVSERTAELQDANAQLEHEMREREDAQAKLRQAQAALIHVSRVSAANTMAATIAHELNQPLAATVNYLRGAERLLRGAGAPEPALEAVGAAARNTHRAGEIIRHLRDLVSNAPLKRQRESLRAMIEDARRLVLLDPAFAGVRCDIALAEGCDAVLVDRVQVEQVLVNLIRNAAEAMAALPVRRIRIDAARDAAQVRVRVRDEGPGFEEVPSDLSIPSFASTKPNGLGIGLSICRTIVEANDGVLTAGNDPAGGAVVTFTLPVARPKAATRQRADSSPNP
jgi:C4-dicarboxylate-specific signal transduction histidine kinase